MFGKCGTESLSKITLDENFLFSSLFLLVIAHHQLAQVNSSQLYYHQYTASAYPRQLG